METSLANTSFQPSVVDGTNYSLRKFKIRYYIKSIDKRAWQHVINEWTSSMMIDQDGDSLPKSETDWTADEVKNLNYNSKALNAIFTSVDMNMFSLIINCISAKNAWDTLQKHCEDSDSVRRTRLRMLTSKFEIMMMEESKNILDYDRRLWETANEAFSLGDPISNEQLVSKVLRSFHERFNVKICAIDEAKDTSQMALEDLISSLHTFEMNMGMQKKDKGKTIAFQKFGDYLKRITDKKKAGQPSKFPSLPAPKPPVQQQFRRRNEGKSQFNSKNYDSVQCRESNGFGHYANECANRLRKNKGYNVSLSDEEYDEEDKSNDEDNHTSLTALVYDELEADDEEITLESVQKLYEELYSDWIKRNKLNSTLMKENTELKVVVVKIEVILSKKDLELGKTKDELQKTTESLSKFNSSTSKLESILLMGRDDKKGLGFKDSLFEIGESSKSIIFVKGKADTSTQSQSTPPKRQPAAHVPKEKTQVIVTLIVEAHAIRQDHENIY
ncbi:uncharacterized protein LOC142532391 [Primulina tabacum]|uniref:uncharacterized protein LOC142532391 n=1 Tax=Primulina tabacum TaxID=48773 RepID=UPI003F597456